MWSSLTVLIDALLPIFYENSLKLNLCMILILIVYFSMFAVIKFPEENCWNCMLLKLFVHSTGNCRQHQHLPSCHPGQDHLKDGWNGHDVVIVVPFSDRPLNNLNDISINFMTITVIGYSTGITLLVLQLHCTNADHNIVVCVWFGNRWLLFHVAYMQFVWHDRMLFHST